MYLYYYLCFSFEALWDVVTLLLCLSVTNLKVLENNCINYSGLMFIKQHFQSLDKLNPKLV